MIFDCVKNADLYFGISPELDAGLRFIKNYNRSQFKKDTPRVELEYGGFVLFQSYEPKKEEEQRYEKHRKYIDIQFLVNGDELVYVRDTKGLTPVEPYNAEKDFEFFDSADFDAKVVLKEGWFAIFFPNDAHKPSVQYKSAHNDKIVVKIKSET